VRVIGIGPRWFKPGGGLAGEKVEDEEEEGKGGSHEEHEDVRAGWKCSLPPRPIRSIVDRGGEATLAP